MRENLLKKQPTWGLRRAQRTGQKSATPATLTKVILVLLTMFLIPSAAWGQTVTVTKTIKFKKQVDAVTSDIKNSKMSVSVTEQITGESSTSYNYDGQVIILDDYGQLSQYSCSTDGGAVFTLKNDAPVTKNFAIEIPGVYPNVPTQVTLTVAYNDSGTDENKIKVGDYGDGTQTTSPPGTGADAATYYHYYHPYRSNETSLYETTLTYTGNNTSGLGTNRDGPGSLIISISLSGGATFTIKEATITYETNNYGLTVAGIPVTNVNASAVLFDKENWGGDYEEVKGTVSFTPAGTNPATLTLNDADLTYTEGNVIVSTLTTPLEVNLLGSNHINSGSNLPFEGATGDLVFNTSDQNPGTLMMESTKDGFSPTTFYSGFNSVSYSNGSNLYAYNYESGKVMIEQATSYGLTVGGVEVTSANCDDILKDDSYNAGKVSFKPAIYSQTSSTPATLTLNGATIEDEIKWTNNSNLSIIINGKNSITPPNTGNAAIRCTYTEASANLSFKKAEGDDEKTLIIQSKSSSLISGFQNSSAPNIGDGLKTVRDQDGNSYMGITTRDVYELSVGGTQVHDIQELPGYKDNILGDTEKATAKFELTGENSGKLTLDNAVIYGTIMSDLSNLTVHVIGNNLITYGFIQGYINNENIGNNNLILEKEDGNSFLSIERPSSSLEYIYGFMTFTSTDFVLFGFSNSSTSALSGTFTYNTTAHSLVWEGEGNSEDVKKMKACILFEGNGTDTSPYKIKAKEDLAKLSNFVSQGLITNQYFEIVNDINCSGLDFTPIFGFYGTLEGNNKTISYLSINSNNSTASTGLFSKLGYDDYSGTVQNLKLSNCSFIGPDDVGAVVGYFHKGTIKNCEISSCTIQCGDAQSPRVGGIAGQVLSGTNSISGCKVSNTTITASTTYTSGEGTVSVGGIAGYVYSGCEVTECEATSVTINAHHSNGSSNAGGIAGFFEGSNLKDNTVKGTTSISTTDAAANFKAGAIVGEISTEISTDATMANNIYYYAVTITSGKGTSDENTKSGYIHRGTNSDTDPEGVVMYTKNVIIPILNDAGYVSIDADYYYKVTSDNNNTTYNVAPGAEVLVYVEGAAIEGSYTLDNETKAITLTPKEDSSYGYTFDMPDADVTFTIQKAAWVEMFEEQTYATYYNPNEDMAVPMGMTAYIVTGISEDGTKVTVSPVSYIKAGVAVLVEKGEIGEISETTDFSGSKMAYSDPDTPAKPSATDKWYVIYNNKFVKVTTGTEVSGGKCYLNLNSTPSSGTRSYYDIDGNDGTTGIREVKSEGVKGEKLADGAWHDLQGRKFTTKPTKPGLYILNGKKVVIK